MQNTTSDSENVMKLYTIVLKTLDLTFSEYKKVQLSTKYFK